MMILTMQIWTPHWASAQTVPPQSIDLKDLLFNYDFTIIFAKPSSQPFGLTQRKKSFSYTTPRRGYFCRMEDRQDRIQKLATRFRLGSVDYTNYMEGKTSSTQLGINKNSSLVSPLNNIIRP